MKTTVITALFLVFSGLGASGTASFPRHPDKIDAGLRMLLRSASSGPATAIQNKESGLQSVRILLCGDGAEPALLAHGGLAYSKIGRIVTGELSLSEIPGLADEPGVEKISAGHTPGILNDFAAAHTGADAVRRGDWPLASGYTGKNVIVGIIDTGIDIHHLDFRNADGTSRILYIWDQLAVPEGRSPSGPGFSFSYGREWTKAEIDGGTCAHRDTDGHGTHISGTAAGNGSSTGFYSGMAPKADLIVVALDFGSSIGILDGANYIFKRAELLGRPCVINASVGGHAGPHDGSDLESQGLEALVSEKTGRLFCAAAGNEAGDLIHVSYPASTDSFWTYFHGWEDGIIQLYIRIPNEFLASFKVAVGADASDYNPVDSTGGPWSYWGRTSWFSYQNLEDEGGGKAVPFRAGGKRRGGIEFDIETVSDSVSAIRIRITDDLSWQNPGSISDLELWRLMAWNVNPRIHVWIADIGAAYPFQVDNPRYLYPDSRATVGMPATGRKVIAVGSSVNRTEYESQSGGTWIYPDAAAGEIAKTSSRGPSADGRIKPDITAPGVWVISSLSGDSREGVEFDPSYVVKGGRHMVMSGTSVASPVAAGCLALFLQQNPDAGFDRVMTDLRASASHDRFTGPDLPDNDWGYGKLNIWDMMRTNGIRSPETPPFPLLEQARPNPFNAATIVRYRLPTGQQAELFVFDALGRRILTPLQGFQRPGLHAVSIDGSRWPAGLYFIRLKSESGFETRKMLLIK
ncbi:S8 family peptidase [bacterium]|nr:S8 family peptidase [bacterium]